MTTLGVAPDSNVCEAFGINKRGDVVGRCDQRPVLWSDGTVIELSTLPGNRGALPLAINDRGWVVGQGTTADGNGHAVLWMK